MYLSTYDPPLSFVNKALFSFWCKQNLIVFSPWRLWVNLSTGSGSLIKLRSSVFFAEIVSQAWSIGEICKISVFKTSNHLKMPGKGDSIWYVVRSIHNVWKKKRFSNKNLFKYQSTHQKIHLIKNVVLFDFFHRVYRRNSIYYFPFGKMLSKSYNLSTKKFEKQKSFQ